MKTETPDYATMEAGPALDAAVAEHVMGWVRKDRWWFDPKTGFYSLVEWSPSIEMSDAVDVIKKLSPTGSGWHIRWDGEKFYVCLSQDSNWKISQSLPLALCRAALLAVARNGGAA